MGRNTHIHTMLVSRAALFFSKVLWQARTGMVWYLYLPCRGHYWLHQGLVSWLNETGMSSRVHDVPSLHGWTWDWTQLWSRKKWLSVLERVFLYNGEAFSFRQQEAVLWSTSDPKCLAKIISSWKAISTSPNFPRRRSILGIHSRGRKRSQWPSMPTQIKSQGNATRRFPATSARATFGRYLCAIPEAVQLPVDFWGLQQLYTALKSGRG